MPEREPDDAALTRFLTSSPAARTVAASLRDGAEVGVTFTELVGEWRFFVDHAEPWLEPGKAKDPDFELRLPPGAVKAICSQTDADIGDLGVAFFEHIITLQPEKKIRVTLRSGLVKLTKRGWVGVLAKGGPKVMGWLARKGLRGPGAVASALARLRGK
jgi:hypothetical protein